MDSDGKKRVRAFIKKLEKETTQFIMVSDSTIYAQRDRINQLLEGDLSSDEMEDEEEDQDVFK